MRNSENILGSKSTTWTAKKEMISVKNITGSELAGGVKDHSSKSQMACTLVTSSATAQSAGIGPKGTPL